MLVGSHALFEDNISILGCLPCHHHGKGLLGPLIEGKTFQPFYGWLVRHNAVYSVAIGRLNTGIQLVTDRGDDDMFVTFCAIAAIQPTVLLSQTNKGTMTPGVAIGSVSLRDLVSGATSRGVAPITFTFNEEIEHAQEIGGPEGMTTYEITPVWDGTNAPIVMTGLA